jgi:hypothetical protein
VPNKEEGKNKLKSTYFFSHARSFNL